VVYLSFSRSPEGEWIADNNGNPLPASLELVKWLEKKYPTGESQPLSVQVVPSSDEIAIPALGIFIIDINNFIIGCEQNSVDPLKIFWRIYNMKFPDRTTLFVAYPADRDRRTAMQEFVGHVKVGIEGRGKRVCVVERQPVGIRNAKDIDVFCSAEIAFAYGFPFYTSLTFFGGDGDYAHALGPWAANKGLAVVCTRNNCSMEIHNLGAETIFLEDLAPPPAS